MFGSIGLGPDQTFDLAYLQIWGTMKDDILPAVPLFIFMGYMTEQAGLMERLFLALRHLLAPVRGSLYLAVILTATIFAMATGIVGAAVTVLGIMAGPIMIKTGYDARLSAGRHRRRRHARHPDPAERHAGGDGPDHGRAGEPALLGRLRARASCSPACTSSTAWSAASSTRRSARRCRRRSGSAMPGWSSRRS